MVQFKDCFLGTSSPVSNKIATVQKCVRAGGKHNDLDNVGYTPRHHTFFEMLGNFGFQGAVTKRDAIEYAIRFLDVLKLPNDRLGVSVHEDDSETFEIWRHVVGFSEDRVWRLREDNIWSMGDGAGPYGHCTEIFFDRNPGLPFELGPKSFDEKWLEIWNVVFMQFRKDAKGNHAGKLEHLCVDTGMGLERLASVLQGVGSNFETDEFSSLISSVYVRLSRGRVVEGIMPTDSERIALRVVADHVRAISFLVSDGVIPHSVGRGYVLRRIIRRAVRYAAELQRSFGHTPIPILHELCSDVAVLMKDPYPQLYERIDSVSSVVLGEERAFLATLGHGLHMLDHFLASKNSQVIPGDLAFTLHDSCGFPLDLTCSIARDRGLTVDLPGFEQRMERQKESSKQKTLSSRGDSVVTNDVKAAVIRGGLCSRFVGYDTLDCSASRVLVFEPESPEVVWVVLDVSPFYAEGGGQVGDSGRVDFRLAGDTILEGSVESVLPVPGAQSCSMIKIRRLSGLNLSEVSSLLQEDAVPKNISVSCFVDAEVRSRTAAHHTATHLLHAALREVLGPSIVQAGSHVDQNRLRFDFSYPHGSLTSDQLSRVTAFVNSSIDSGFLVDSRSVSRDDPFAKSAVALFSERYGETVRVVSAGSVSRELCGGTHARSSFELRPFRILSEQAVAAGVRRIEAVAGKAAMEVYRSEERLVLRLSNVVSSSPSALEGRIETLLEKLEKSDALLVSLLKSLALNSARVGRANGFCVAELDELALRVASSAKLATDLHRIVAEELVKNHRACVVVGGPKVSVVSRTDVNANAVVQMLLREFGGKGGGGATFAAGKCNREDIKLPELEKLLSSATVF